MLVTCGLGLGATIVGFAYAWKYARPEKYFWPSPWRLVQLAVVVVALATFLMSPITSTTLNPFVTVIGFVAGLMLFALLDSRRLKRQYPDDAGGGSFQIYDRKGRVVNEPVAPTRHADRVRSLAEKRGSSMWHPPHTDYCDR
ncbi:MAG: hypothetical protein JWO84_720 [Parcubacteria group bacterium]|nr:hypothetical protein [Parcubacteria group bacterium]